MSDGGLLVLFGLQLGLPLLLLLLAYSTGRMAERRHYVSIRNREQSTLSFPTMTLTEPPAGWRIGESELVTGSMVVSVDYFKRFLGALRGLVGGELRSYASLLDRARREALLRMKEAAIRAGYDGVINVRLETSRLASGRRDGKGVAGIEMLAFGTGIKKA